ncbi:MAG: integrase core domain-containing protein [Microthrixaceae bacterium]
MRHDRVAPRTPPPDTGLDLDDPPLPHRSRRDHPEPQEATEIVLHPLPSRSSQRVLAIRLHPLAPRRWRRYRSPRVARRPLPLRTLDHRAPPRHRHSCDRDVPRERRHLWAAGLNADRQRLGVHGALRWRPRRHQQLRDRTRPPRCAPEELPAEPPHHLRQSRTVRQTLKKWLTGQPRATAIDTLQHQLDEFVEIYNHHRPHRSLPHSATPATIYKARPKAVPAPADHDADYRVRHDRIDTTGKITLRHNSRLHHIGIGREHARTHVIVLVADLDIRIVNAATGELLRHLTLDPTRNYQPTGKPRSQKQQNPRT